MVTPQVTYLGPHHLAPRLVAQAQRAQALAAKREAMRAKAQADNEAAWGRMLAASPVHPSHRGR